MIRGLVLLIVGILKITYQTYMIGVLLKAKKSNILADP